MIDLFCVYSFRAARQSDEAELHTFEIDLWGTNPLGSVGGYSPQIDEAIKRHAREHDGRAFKETSGNGARVLQIRHPSHQEAGASKMAIILGLTEWGIEYGQGLSFKTAHHKEHTNHHRTPNETDNPYAAERRRQELQPAQA